MEWEPETEKLFARIVEKMPEGFRPSVKPMIIKAAEKRCIERNESYVNDADVITGIFDIVNPDLMNSELQKHGCIEEKCILRFAVEANIGVVIIGEFDDRGDDLVLRLSSYGTDVPYNGKLIYRYTVKIPMYNDFTSKEYNYICEED